MDRISELVDLLQKASHAYYRGGDAIMSDQEFDALRDELEELDPENAFLAQVGAPVDSALVKVKHVIPMGSLKKITKLTELKTWLRSLGCDNPLIAVELKLDGLSIELVYENGNFIQAVTRGDGQQGEDVSHTIKNAKGFPRTISVKTPVVVRCETVLTIADWKKHFDSESNPRNTASGTVRRSDAVGSEHLTCIAFDVLFDNNEFTTEKDRIEWLKNEKFKVTSCEVVSVDNLEKAIAAIESVRQKLSFEIDGAVLKLNDIAGQKRLGEHKGRPYWARAWKFAPMGGHTILEGVEWSVGTQGTINPVALIKPVKVGGTVIRRVSLHNMDEIFRLRIQIGDKIEVIRAGDVIPKIVRVVEQGANRKPIQLDRCPACNAHAVRDGAYIWCSKSDQCVGVNSSRIKKWISKRKIMYLGDSNTDALIKAGCVSTIADLYSLTKDKMVQAGLGSRISEKILSEIEKSRRCSLPDFIGSLSLNMLGRSEAANLIKQGIDTLPKWLSLTAAQIIQFPGYQQSKSDGIADAVQAGKQLINSVADCLILDSPKLLPQNGSKTGGLGGKSFCFTGTMSKTRDELCQIACDAGGIVSKSVTKGLDFLVVADVNRVSKKSEKAEEYGTKLISELQFLAMVKDATQRGSK